MLTFHDRVKRLISTQQPDWLPTWKNLPGQLCLFIGAAILNHCIIAQVGAAGLPTAEEIEPVTNIQRAAKTFLYRHAGGERGASVKIIVDPIDPRLRLKLCEHDLQTSLAPGARKTGNTSVKIQCQGPVRWSLFVSARVERFGDVLVAASPISRGRLITPADVKLERRETGGILTGYFEDLSDAVGMQARRSVRPGTVLNDSHLKTPLWVERGQLVQLLSETTGIRVSMSGEALEDGGAGDRIRVRNRSSQRELEGVIQSPGVVRVPM
ncbi:Flagella basal body P-ring formation protein FlgA precursor [Thiorhodovibrio winogradskyi]|uniref:Flagella basal body P-ring formation protein FlgA n=1 Tax=Thiorhodovibrio winogradskyi TaxID=77007 RepID=A0ABZ0SHP3_9GAMM|nr:flagellar basal body P-ring formation chaperone FlgA [Thiorhodovibrio winogradskyi]